jgi:vesicle coat complex subunit
MNGPNISQNYYHTVVLFDSMDSGDIPAYLDEAEEQQYADPERAATQVPQLAAVLNGEDNERAAAFRQEAERLVLHKTEYVPAAAARRLYDFSRHHPAVVATQAPTLVRHLDVANEDVRRRVAFAVMHAATEPEPFVEYAPDFIQFLDDDDPVVRGTAAGAIGRIATVAPDEAVPAVDALITIIDDPETGADAIEALARIGDERPAAVTAAAQPVTRHFRALPPASDTEADDTVFRVSALEVISRIASTAPETIDNVNDALRRAIQSSQSNVRWQAAETISALIVARPETFGPLESDLRARIDDEDSSVRRSVALAYLRIARNSPDMVDDSAPVAEYLRNIDADDDLPPDDLTQALQAFDTSTEGDL